MSWPEAPSVSANGIRSPNARAAADSIPVHSPLNVARDGRCCARRTPWLRKYYVPGQDEPRYDLAAAAEEVVH